MACRSCRVLLVCSERDPLCNRHVLRRFARRRYLVDEEIMQRASRRVTFFINRDAGIARGVCARSREEAVIVPSTKPGRLRSSLMERQGNPAARRDVISQVAEDLDRRGPGGREWVWG